jgi:glycosyltransferase involved in cell wall biosynthesis
MKILVISNGWGVKTIGGGELHMLHVMSNWCKDNDVFLIIPRSGFELSKKIISIKYATYFSSNEFSVNSLKVNIFFYVVRVFKSVLMRTIKPDAIVSTSHLLYDVLPAFIQSKRFNSKLIVYHHLIIRQKRKTTRGFYNLLSLLNEKMGIYLSKKADLIFTVDNDTKNYLLKNNFKKEKIHDTFNGINNKIVLSVPASKKEYDGCFCGRITKQKGILDIAEVWKRVIKVLPDAKFILIGDGPDYKLIEDAVNRGGLQKNIILKGFVSEIEKIKLIKSSKIFLFPSYEETWGISVSEALSCEAAVVCYDLIAYDIYGDGIIKTKVGSIDEMAKATIDLLTNDASRTELIEKGNRVINRFRGWDEISSDQLDALKKIVLRDNGLDQSHA